MVDLKFICVYTDIIILPSTMYIPQCPWCVNAPISLSSDAFLLLVSTGIATHPSSGDDQDMGAVHAHKQAADGE